MTGLLVGTSGILKVFTICFGENLEIGGIWADVSRRRRLWGVWRCFSIKKKLNILKNLLEKIPTIVIAAVGRKYG